MDERGGTAGSVVGQRSWRVHVTVVLGLLVVASLWTGAVGGAVGLDHRSGDGPAERVGVGFAQDDGSDADATDGNETVCQRDVSTMVEVYNSQIEAVPGFVTGTVEDTDIFMNVTGEGGGEYTLSANDTGQVTNYSEGEPESASLLVKMDCETFRTVTDAEDPGSAFRSAYDGGEVKIIGLGLFNWLFVEGLKLASDPVSLVLVLAGVLLVVGYVVYRRASIHYRDF
jgi:hypothetical protein